MTEQKDMRLKFLVQELKQDRYLVVECSAALTKTLTLLKEGVQRFPLEEYAEVSVGLKPRLGDSIWGSVYTHKQIFKVDEIANRWRASQGYFIWEVEQMQRVVVGISILHDRCCITTQRIEGEAGYVIRAQLGIDDMKVPPIDYVELEREGLV